MPRGNGLAVGAGIARGAEAFMQSYKQAKLFKQQEKLEKNSVIVQLLMGQLADENKSYDDRAKILRSIPRLYGMKDEDIDPLVRSYEQANKEIVQDPNSPKTPAIPEQKGKAPASEGESQLFPREAVSEGAGGFTGDKPKGELTPAIIKRKLNIEMKKAEDENDLDKQSKLLKLQYTMQKEILGKGGYTEKLPPVYDEDGNLLIKFMRPGDGDINTVNLGKVKTEAVLKAEINADIPKGKFGQLTQAHQIVDAYNRDPTSYSSAQFAAAKGLIEDFERTGQVKDAQINYLNQGIQGTRPIQPAQIADDTRADRNIDLTIQKDIDDAEAEMKSAKGIMDSLEASKKAAGEAITLAQKALDETELSVGEPGYNTLVMNVERARDNYNRIEEKYTSAFAKETEAKGKLAGAKGRMIGTGGRKTYNEGGMGSLSPTSQKYIMEYFQGDVQKAQEYHFNKFGKYLK